MTDINEIRELIEGYTQEEIKYGASEDDAIWNAVVKYSAEIAEIGVEVAEEYLDDLGHLNNTELAEYLADVLDIYVGNNYDIPDNVFDIAFEIGEDLGLNE